MFTRSKMSDFIIVPRSIFEADKFGRETYSKREAFLDLVQMAAYDDTEVFINGYRYVKARGQVVVSKSFLAKKWGWSVDKVRRYMSYLERNGWCECLCDHQCNQPITLISIISYDSYQGGATTPTTTPATTSATTSGSTGDTQLKEIEIEKEEEVKGKSGKKERRKTFVPPTLEEIIAFCKEMNYSMKPEDFLNYYTSKGWRVGNAPMVDWKAAARGWESRGKKYNPPLIPTPPPVSPSEPPSGTPQPQAPDMTNAANALRAAGWEDDAIYGKTK